MHFKKIFFIILYMEETVVRQLSFENPESPGKLVQEKSIKRKPIYQFPFGTRIWRARKMWVIQNPDGIEAVKIIDSNTGKQAKEGKFRLWATEQEAKLYFHGRGEVLPKGYTFSAFNRNAKKTRRQLTITT